MLTYYNVALVDYSLHPRIQFIMTFKFILKYKALYMVAMIRFSRDCLKIIYYFRRNTLIKFNP
jgi:hypothetical protein